MVVRALIESKCKLIFSNDKKLTIKDQNDILNQQKVLEFLRNNDASN